MSVWPQDSHFSQTSAGISSRAPLGCRGFFSLRNHAMAQISPLGGGGATHAQPAERRAGSGEMRGEGGGLGGGKKRGGSGEMEGRAQRREDRGRGGVDALEATSGGSVGVLLRAISGRRSGCGEVRRVGRSAGR